MITKLDAVRRVLGKTYVSKKPAKASGCGWAPSNIALIKYWGKREAELNLPMNDSVSVSLGRLGAYTTLSVAKEDAYYLNGKKLDTNSAFSRRLSTFLALFTNKHAKHFKVCSQMNVPLASGVASSACGFAALVRAIDDLFNLNLPPKKLMILARLGSGSACRSIIDGFSWWLCGAQDDGLDSYAMALNSKKPWIDLRIGLFLVSAGPKLISSREAMARTLATSTSYNKFLVDAKSSLPLLIKAIKHQDLETLGVIAERSATLMHQAMLDCTKPIDYSTRDTKKLKDLVIKARQKGLKVYFTQDAGSNLQILFNACDLAAIKEHFKAFSKKLIIVAPLADSNQLVERLDEKTQCSLGLEPKLLAHYRGDLHRAFSVMLTRLNARSKIEVLLQQRSEQKYHSPGCWSNACCGHPKSQASVTREAAKRLDEELGVKVAPNQFKPVGHFIYQAKLGEGMQEYEFDHLVELRWLASFGEFECHLNPAEVSKVRWIGLEQLKAKLAREPKKFSAWLAPLLACYEASKGQIKKRKASAPVSRF